MELEQLDNKTQARLKGLEQATNSKPEKIIKEAVKQFSEAQGDQLFMMQGQQAIQQNKNPELAKE